MTTAQKPWGRAPVFGAFAFDRASVRTIDQDGRLRVQMSNLTGAAVNPYRGDEIPDAQALGLNPTQIYQIFRPPEELARAVASFNNLPILSRHVPVTAEDHQPGLVVGATGTDAEFVAPFLRNSLIIWAASAIAGIESGEQRELSAAYRYRAVPDRGSYLGEPYDLRMTDIRANHVALVPMGRVSGAIVCDAMPTAMDAAAAERAFNLRFPGASRLKTTF